MTEKVIFEGRNVGELYTRFEDNVPIVIFRKHCKPEHFCVKYQAFGITTKVFNYLQDQGVKEIEVLYDGAKDWVYRIKLDKFGEAAIPDKLGGFDPQLFVNVNLFEAKKRLK